MDRAIAASGVLVVVIDMTLAPEAPYPACVQDANYAVRWLKMKAASWNGDPSKIGMLLTHMLWNRKQLLLIRKQANDRRRSRIAIRIDQYDFGCVTGPIRDMREDDGPRYSPFRVRDG